jgi:hypothetical protein
MNTMLRLLLLSAGCITTTGCANWQTLLTNTPQDSKGPRLPVTEASLPSIVQPYPRIERVLACIHQSNVLRGRTFVVGPFADSTGKINAVAPGSTGNFVPQGGSASYITDALTKAGGRVVSTYFGQPAKSVPAQYAINGIFNSLDFGSPMAADVRVGGIGPTFASGWAQLSLTIQLDQVATRVNQQISMIQRPVRYTQVGVGAGRDIGGVLLTGNIAVQNQERLQLEALNGPIALGVADVVMREFPRARDKCGGIVSDLLSVSETATSQPAAAPTESSRRGSWNSLFSVQ